MICIRLPESCGFFRWNGPERFPSHVLRRAFRLFLPREEHLRVAIGDVIRRIDPELARSSINPFRRTLDFGDIADRSLVHDHVTGSVTPLGAKFLVLEARHEPLRNKDFGEGFPLLNLSLSLNPCLVLASVALRFMCDLPYLSVFSDAQQFTTVAERPLRSVI